MAVSYAQVRSHRYVCGWREAPLYHRCMGKHAGTACACPCHRQAATEGQWRQPGLRAPAREMTRAGEAASRRAPVTPRDRACERLPAP